MIKKTRVAEQIISFLGSLQITVPLPKSISVLNPYQDTYTMQLCGKFYTKYYSDASPRKIMLGINPGRLGGGLTGIPFTDPVHLQKFCGIKNELQKKAELSSTFIYEMINEYGGPEKFYSRIYISSVSPLGFTREGKNLNYYDDARLQKKLEPFIISCMETQLNFGIDRSVAYCLGEGQNFKFLEQMNDQYKFFDKIIPLPHPRFILQYKRKNKSDYIQRYIDALT